MFRIAVWEFIMEIPPSKLKKRVPGQRELVLWANVVVICLRIMLIVSKSQLGKYGIDLKIVCINRL